LKQKSLLIGVSSLNVGGAEKQAIDDANMLCTRFRVLLLAFADGPMRDLLDPAIEVIIIPRKGYISTIRKVAGLVRKFRIDLMHAHLYAPMVIMAVAGQITSRPVIWNFHSHAFENRLFPKLLHKYTGKLSAVKKILFPASQLKIYYDKENYGFPYQKVAVAFNSGQQHPETLRPENENKVVRIGYIGRFVSLKRIEYLVELADRFLKEGRNNFVIDLVGDGQELEPLKEMVRSRNLENHVNFHGFHKDTLPYFSIFSIFTLPSREEVLSLSLIDAGLAGLPSVAFQIGGNDDIITDGITGYLVDTLDEFISKTAYLLDHPEIRKSLGDQARVDCRNKFSKEARLNYLTGIYEIFLPLG
jgi:glycosyltransferase involved in cell wall biosynthesis